jgi:hypothetical protein
MAISAQKMKDESAGRPGNMTNCRLILHHRHTVLVMTVFSGTIAGVQISQ